MTAPAKSIQEACRLIKEDMESDVHRLDGAPFTGATLGEIHGNLSAAVSALAGMVAVLDARLATHVHANGVL